MTRLRYVDRNFRADSLQIIAQANQIIDAYAAQGYDLTLRQLYYRFVAQDLIANKQSEYKRLGSIINDARLAGLVDWDRIVDRTRNVRDLSHWQSPESIIEAAASSYREELWREQPVRVECWIEKDALVGIFEPVCQDLDIPLFSCRGYTSQSEAWAAARRLERYLSVGQEVVVLHFGDHDPSGLDMTRDIRERLGLFLQKDWARALWREHREELEAIGDPTERFNWVRDHAVEGLRIPWHQRLEVRRLALTWEQVRQYDPPPNPAKETDSRFADYAAEHGDESWELDALEPTVLGGLLSDQVDELRDQDAWNAALERQESRRGVLERAAERWGEVEELLA